MATKVAVRYVSRRFSSGTSASSGGADAKASDFTASTSSTAGVAVVAGVVTGLGALVWYLESKIRVHQEETLSKVIELNNKPRGHFCPEVHVGRGGTTIRFKVLNSKRSRIVCSEVRVGRGGTTMRWKEIPQGIGPARPNENLTEV